MISAMRARVAAAAASALEGGFSGAWASDSLVVSDGAAGARVGAVMGCIARGAVGAGVGGLETTVALGVGRVEGSDERGPVRAPGGPGTCFCGAGAGAGAGVGVGAVVTRGMGGS
jgi:hypothetical protein